MPSRERTFQRSWNLIYNSQVRAQWARPNGATSRLFGVAVVVAMLAACGEPPLDIEALSIEGITTGWLDVGIDELGRNKLVPTISFRLTNASTERIRYLQLNGVFRRCIVVYPGQPEVESEVSPADPLAGTCGGEMQVWGSSFIRAVGREGLEPGESTDAFTMDSGLGYTGEQARLEMLQHREFVDVKVELFVKHEAEQWAKLGEHSIERQLLTQ